MCFSIRANQHPFALARAFGAGVDVPTYLDLFEARVHSSRFVLPPAMESAFLEEGGVQDLSVASERITRYYNQARAELERKIMEVRRAGVELERKFASKETKTHRQSLEANQRQAARFLDKLAVMKPGGRAERIFPRHFTSSVLNVNGELVEAPVRYGVFRRSGALLKDIIDDDAPGYGLYNCRLDSLDAARFEQLGFQLRSSADKRLAAAHQQFKLS